MLIIRSQKLRTSDCSSFLCPQLCSWSRLMKHCRWLQFLSISSHTFSDTLLTDEVLLSSPYIYLCLRRLIGSLSWRGMNSTAVSMTELDFQMCQLYTLIAQPVLGLSAMKTAQGPAAELGGGPADRILMILTHLSAWGRPDVDNFLRLHLTHSITIGQQFFTDCCFPSSGLIH